MRKAFILVIVLVIVAGSLAAQHAVTGKVYDAQKKPLPNVSVTLLHTSDSATAAITQTDSLGDYRFNNIASGNYTIRVTAVGMQQYHTASFEINTLHRQQAVADIILVTEAKELAAVNVISPKNTIAFSDGKLTYTVEKNATAPGSTAFDQLRLLPGVTVDGEDNLALKGSGTVTILIDGKPTYLGPQQLGNYLKSIPAENLVRIEIMNIPSSQFDAAGSAGVINIITKKMNRQGYALNLRAGMGTGKYIQSSDGFIGNIRTKRFNLFGSYTYNYTHYNLVRSSYRTISNNGVITNYDRHSVDPSITKNHNYKAGIDIYLDKKTTVGFVYNGSNNHWQRNAGGPTYLSDADGDIDSIAQNKNITIEPSRNNTYNINFSSRLDTLGGLVSVDADYARYRNSSTGSLDNGIYAVNNVPLQPYQSLAFDQPAIITIRSVKTDVVLPSKKSVWKAGAKYAFVTTDNNFRYDSLINGSYVYSPALSNHFTYDEKVAAAYLSFSAPLSTAISADLGIRVEHTSSKGNLINTNTVTRLDYTNLFPYLSLKRKLRDDNSITFSISRRINRPVYANLNPSRFFFDKYSYYEGNPFLRPELSWNTALTYTLAQKYIATLTYSRTNDAILDFALQDSVGGILKVTNRNYGYKNAADLLLVIPVKLFPFWSVQATADIIYLDYFYNTGKDIFRPRKWNVDLQLMQAFSLPGGISGDLLAYYTSPSLSGAYILKTYFQVDAGAKKSFLKNKLDVTVSLKDFLRTNRYRGYSIYNATNVSYNHRPDSRRINLALTYHIGGKLSTGRERRLEEQERL